MSLAAQGLRGLLDGLNLAKYYDVMVENEVRSSFFEPLSSRCAGERLRARWDPRRRPPRRTARCSARTSQ